MLRFVRLLGGALGVILAISLAGFSETLSDPSAASRLTLLAWAVAWAVVGFSIMPYITITPARWLMRAVTDMSTDEFVAAVVGLILVFPALAQGNPAAALSAITGTVMSLAFCVVIGRSRDGAG